MKYDFDMFHYVSIQLPWLLNFAGVKADEIIVLEKLISSGHLGWTNLYASHLQLLQNHHPTK